jgi:predicted enzyme related to lactoylglutathione lyase
VCQAASDTFQHEETAMGFEIPKVPSGSGKHPIALVVVSANDLAASGKFYSKLFGWQLQPMSAELTGVVAPGGPTAALRSQIPAGFPGIVPYIAVSNVEEALARVVAAGGTIEKATWTVPMVGKLARFKDPSGTIYGLTGSLPPGDMPRMPMPVGSNAKPPAGAICHVEMYAADGSAAARFFTDLFGWGTLETMPQYMAFDPGAGVAGIFQSHTPSLPALAYLYVTDVDATLAAIEAAGGKLTGKPMRMPGAGCFGYFTDPSGTSMGLIGP